MNYHLINESKLQEIADLWDYCFEKKDTFSKRILTEEPKFVQKRKDTEK